MSTKLTKHGVVPQRHGYVVLIRSIHTRYPREHRIAVAVRKVWKVHHRHKWGLAGVAHDKALQIRAVLCLKGLMVAFNPTISEKELPSLRLWSGRPGAMHTYRPSANQIQAPIPRQTHYGTVSDGHASGMRVLQLVSRGPVRICCRRCCCKSTLLSSEYTSDGMGVVHTPYNVRISIVFC